MEITNQEALEDYVKGLCKTYGCSYDSFRDVLNLEFVKANEANDFSFAGIYRSRLNLIMVFDRAKFLDRLREARRVCDLCHGEVQLTLGHNDQAFAVFHCKDSNCGWQEEISYLASVAET